MSCDNLGWKHSLCMLEASDVPTGNACRGRNWPGARLNNQPQWDATAVYIAAYKKGDHQLHQCIHCI